VDTYEVEEGVRVFGGIEEAFVKASLNVKTSEA